MSFGRGELGFAASPDGASSMKALLSIAEYALYLIALRLGLECLYDLYFALIDPPWRAGYLIFAGIMAALAFGFFVSGSVLANKLKQ